MSKWNDLSMTQKGEVIKMAVKSNIKDIESIRNLYNEYAKGGPISSFDKRTYDIWKREMGLKRQLDIDNDNTYDYESYYNADPEAAWRMLNDKDTSVHFVDTYKTVYHPTFSKESIYSGKKDPKYNPDGLEGGSWLNNQIYKMSEDGYRAPVSMDERKAYLEKNEPLGAALLESDGSLPVYDGVRWGGVLPTVDIVAPKRKKKYGGSLHKFLEGGESTIINDSNPNNDDPNNDDYDPFDIANADPDDPDLKIANRFGPQRGDWYRRNKRSKAMDRVRAIKAGKMSIEEATDADLYMMKEREQNFSKWEKEHNEELERRRNSEWYKREQERRQKRQEEREQRRTKIARDLGVFQEGMDAAVNSNIQLANDIVENVANVKERELEDSQLRWSGIKNMIDATATAVELGTSGFNLLSSPIRNLGRNMALRGARSTIPRSLGAGTMRNLGHSLYRGTGNKAQKISNVLGFASDLGQLMTSDNTFDTVENGVESILGGFGVLGAFDFLPKKVDRIFDAAGKIQSAYDIGKHFMPWYNKENNNNNNENNDNNNE